MPLYMDVHDRIEGLTAEAVADAHRKDLETQDQHGVHYHRYWFDTESGKVFCLVEAPSKEAAEQVHREAHGLVADQLTADPTHGRTDELVSQLREEVVFLRGQLDQRSRELAEERQRFDVIHREALGRIEALTAGGSLETVSSNDRANAGETREDVPQSRQEGPQR